MKRALVAALLLLAAGAVAAADLVAWTPLAGPELDRLRADARAFGDAAGLEVAVASLPEAAIEHRLSAAEEGGAADVVVGLPHERLARLAARGVLADLGAYATPEHLADLSPRARAALRREGRLHGLPLSVEGPALVYNRALVDAPPATYDAFVALARELATDDAPGFLHDLGNFYFDYGWLASHGGYVFGRDEDGVRAGDVGLANEGAVRGAEALRALRHVHGLAPRGSDHRTAQDLFVAGRLAMFYTGPWTVRPAREAGVDVGAAPMPRVDGRPWTSFMSVRGVAVSAFAARRADAANLAKWLARADAQAAYARLAGRIPASRAARARVADDPVLAGFAEALDAAEPIPSVPEMGNVWWPMGNALTEIVRRPDADVATILERAVRGIVAGSP